MNTRTFLARVVALAIALSIGYTIISEMVDEIQRGVFIFTQFFGYFTVQAGCLTAVVMSGIALAPLRLAPSLSYARGAVTLYMTMTLLIYHLLESPPGTWRIDEWSTIHVFAPILLLLLWWMLLPPHSQECKWWWPLSWTMYPLIFATTSIVRGNSDTWYPYGFLDVDANGLSFVAGMVAGLAGGVTALGYLLLMPSFILQRRLSSAN